MLRVMARDLAAVHLGLIDSRKAIGADLAKRKDGWLADAIKRAAAFVRAEQREWRKGAEKAA
jgi:hypothetical protein